MLLLGANFSSFRVVLSSNSGFGACLLFDYIARTLCEVTHDNCLGFLYDRKRNRLIVESTESRCSCSWMFSHIFGWFTLFDY